MLTVSNAANPGALSHDLLALHPDSVEKDNFDTPIMHPLGVTCILTGLGHAAHIRKGTVPPRILDQAEAFWFGAVDSPLFALEAWSW